MCKDTTHPRRPRPLIVIVYANSPRSVTATLHNLPFRAWERSINMALLRWFTLRCRHPMINTVYPNDFCNFFILFYRLYISFKKCGPPYLGKARLQQQQEQQYPVLQVHAWSFPVSVIHQTLTWITGSLTCVRDYFYIGVSCNQSWIWGIGETSRLMAQLYIISTDQP